MAKKRKGGSSHHNSPKKSRAPTQRQCAEPSSPPPGTSDSESIASSSDCSMSTCSSTSSNKSTTPALLTVTKPSAITQPSPPTVQPPPTKTSTIRPPPLILSSSSWRKVAPSVFKLPNLKPDCLTAKSSSTGQILIQTSDIQHFRMVQKTLIDQKTEFHTFSLPEDRTLKVVLKGIPTDITTEELKSELETLNFRVTYVRRFGTPDKPIPMCLVHIAADLTSKDIYQLSSLFYLQISVESFKSSGPAQCFSCQRFGHGSRNCGHPLRCVKCAGNHTAKDCPKTPEQTPTCCNCSGPHTANFRGCPEYIKQRELLNTPTPTTKPVLPINQTPAKPITRQQLPPPPPPTQNTIQPSKTYATATTGSSPPTPSTSAPTTSPSAPPTINLQQILILLTNLLTAISTNQNPVSIIETTIKTFLTILSPQNG